ncbi:MAG: UDP-N-acetylmuramate dehydrogenase [Mycobacteriales bacterium]|nr:UDP-N-acetylmuramate dehydrogenase [Frankia sp.]
MSDAADEFLPTPWCPAADRTRVAAVVDEIERRGVAVRRDAPLAAATTFGVGGAARCFVEVVDAPALAALLDVLGGTDESEVPLLVVGRGSNLLIADDGFPGIVLRLGNGFRELHIVDATVTAGGAVSMPALAAATARAGLAGLEFAAGIPASVGGSVRMNAGAHGRDTGQSLVWADVAAPDATQAARVPRDALGLGYRTSSLGARSVVVAASWRLARDDPTATQSRVAEMRAYRRRTQPLRERNCGSVFTNPPGESAGRLIEAAGLKGLRRGAARVSSKHANFIVVDAGARASDVWHLIGEVRRRIVERGGPLLMPEVRIVGEFAVTR